jgi:hypothetical protein
MLTTVIERISDTGFIQIALILFVSVFISVLIREAMRPRREVARMASMALEDETDSKKGATP